MPLASWRGRIDRCRCSKSAPGGPPGASSPLKCSGAYGVRSRLLVVRFRFCLASGCRFQGTSILRTQHSDSKFVASQEHGQTASLVSCFFLVLLSQTKLDVIDLIATVQICHKGRLTPPCGAAPVCETAGLPAWVENQAPEG